MADLGEAKLVLSVDDGPLRQGLAEARRFIEKEVGTAITQGTTRGTARARSTGATSTTTGAGGGGITRDDVRRLNLRGLTAALNDVSKSIQKADFESQIKEGLRIGRLNVSPVQGGPAFPGSPGAILAEKRLVEARERSAAAANRAQTAEARLEARRRATEAKRSQDIIANTLIGFGFPLLFGQGIPAAVGGGVGGAAGGALGGKFGFALSIFGTALGQAFTNALDQGKALADGLDDPIRAFETLREAALLSSREVERRAAALIAAGRQEEAAELIRRDTLERFGGVEEFERIRDATDRSSRALASLRVQFAKQVAEPIADLLEEVDTLFGNREAQQQINADIARARELFRTDPEARRQFEDIVARSNNQLNRLGRRPDEQGRILLITQQEEVALARELLKLRGEATASEKAAAAASERSLEATEGLKQANELNLDIIRQSVRGNKLLTLELQKQAVELDRNRKLEALGDDVPRETREAIEIEAAKELTRLQEERVKAQQAIDKAAFDELQQRQNITRSIADTQQLLGAQQGTYRSTLRTVQQIAASIEDARQREAALAFEISQARATGRPEDAARLVERALGLEEGKLSLDESSLLSLDEGIARLVDQQRTAAQETRQQLVEGALALKEAGEQLRDNLRNATLEFTRIRSDPQGLSRFLSPRAQQRRAQADTQRLQPALNEALGRFTELTGISARGFRTRGTPVQRNEAIRDFINTVNREFEAFQNLTGAQQSLEQVNTSLVDVTSRLAETNEQLVQKEWTVQVNVAKQGDGSVSLDIQNGLLQ